MNTIHVPALECPVPSRISPYVAAAEVEVTAWMRKFNLAGDAAILHYASQGFIHMTGRFYPEISYERLVILGKFYTLLFLSDDQLDHQQYFKDKAYWQGFAKDFMNVVKGKVFYKMGDENPPLAALSELWAEMARLSTHAWQQQFIQSLWSMYQAAFWENTNIDNGTPISLEDYIAKRQYLGAANIATDAISFAYPGLNIPKMAAHNPSLIRMVEICRNTVCWANDLFSLGKELEHGGIHNLVLLIQQKTSSCLDSALAQAAAFHNSEVQEFYRRWTDCRIYSEHVKHRIDKYIGALLDLMRGNIDWSIKDTTRYYGFTYDEQVATDHRRQAILH